MAAAAAAAASAAEPGTVALPSAATRDGFGVVTGGSSSRVTSPYGSETFDIQAALAEVCGEGPLPRTVNVSRNGVGGGRAGSCPAAPVDSGSVRVASHA